MKKKYFVNVNRTMIDIWFLISILLYFAGIISVLAGGFKFASVCGLLGLAVMLLKSIHDKTWIHHYVLKHEIKEEIVR